MRARPFPRRRALPAVLALLLATACGGAGGPTGPRPGAAGVGDPLFPDLGNGGYDVGHYGLTLDYDPATGRLRGTAVITADAREDLSSFNLDLKGLTVRSVRVGGEDARTTRKGGELTVVPAKPLKKHAGFRTVVVYEGEPQQITDPDGSTEGWVATDDGAVGLGEPAGSTAWFPGNHHPSDKATYDITVTVPEGFTAVANGELTSAERGPGGRTAFTWHTGQQMASYLATVAVGRFTVTTAKTPHGLPVYVAAAPGQADAAARTATLLPQVLDWGSRLFGPYPFSSTGAVVDSNPDVGYALETQPKPYFHAAPDDRTVVHEVAHQWFGNSVTPRTWRDMWLNEGFATYAEWLWEEQHGGRTARQIFADYYSGKDPQSRGIWAFPPDAPTARTVSDPPVYGRGAMVLHKLRERLGDRAFFAVLQRWTQLYRYSNAGTDAFVHLVESTAGKKEADEVFATWLHAAGKPASPGD
ncbi:MULTISPECIES: M1 family metallopeptidase [Streptomyces]|uniref:Aminopeptidase N n=1 Tax=Streptomyces luteosporeus TaxID=173856 RepID=A0ABN3TRW9_9ACTN